jgi:hypothetical protein
MDDNEKHWQAAIYSITNRLGFDADELALIKQGGSHHEARRDLVSVISNLYLIKDLEILVNKIIESEERSSKTMTRLTIILVICTIFQAVAAVAQAIAAIIQATQ